MVVPIGGLVILFLWACLNWDLSRVTLGIGISLDAIGAFVLAIPDLPMVHRHSFSGKLQIALDQLKITKGGEVESGLAAPDTEERLLDALSIVHLTNGVTIDEYLDARNIIRGSDPPEDGFYELVESFKENEVDEGKSQTWKKVYGMKAFDDGQIVRAIIMMEEDGIPQKYIEGPYFTVFGQIEDVLEDYEGRFRRLGIALLIIGFAFQGVSLLFS